MAHEKLLNIVNISKTYRQRHIQKKYRSFEAVKKVSLTINNGNNFGLIGESGSGKTTLARLMTKILSPSGGDVFLRGKNISQLPIKDIAKIVQIVFQDASSSLNPRMKIRQILLEPIRVHGCRKTDNSDDVINEMINEVGLDKTLLIKYPFDLSGGQRQRVCIARALVSHPNLIIFDEAFSSSDFINNHQIIGLLKKIQSKRDISYFFIDHDLRFIKMLCDTIGVMYNGELVYNGPTEGLFLNQEHHYAKKIIKYYNFFREE